MRIKDYIEIAIVVAIGLLLSICVRRSKSGNKAGDKSKTEIERVIIYDTVYIKTPVYYSEKVMDYKRYKVLTEGTEETEETEGTEGTETIVEMPIIQRHYCDSTYEAWVSGPVDPKLDSLKVYAKKEIITITEKVPQKRWHIGPSIGLGFNGREIRPYIGISVTYTLATF